MKTARLFFFALLLTSLPACSQTSNEFIISGHIQGVEDGDSVLYSWRRYGQDTERGCLRKS